MHITKMLINVVRWQIEPVGITSGNGANETMMTNIKLISQPAIHHSNIAFTNALASSKVTGSPGGRI
jgi:hypothetical protein